MGTEQGESGLAKSSIVIFLDENHCRNRHLIETIEECGIQCEKHLDHFPPGTEDAVWLPRIGRLGWCLVTTDARIRYNFLEKEAVRLNFVRMFYFAKNNLSGKEMGVALKAALPEIMSLASRQPAPFTASISKTGEVRLRDTFQLQKDDS